MKKIVLMVIALVTMTVAYAENENTNSLQATEAYDMHVNIRRLAVTIGLDNDQTQAVQDIHQNFCDEMMLAAQATGEEREQMVNQAIRKDVRYMRYVLNQKQYKHYLLLLNTTLHNRGIK